MSEETEEQVPQNKVEQDKVEQDKVEQDKVGTIDTDIPPQLSAGASSHDTNTCSDEAKFIPEIVKPLTKEIKPQDNMSYGLRTVKGWKEKPIMNVEKYEKINVKRIYKRICFKKKRHLAESSPKEKYGLEEKVEWIPI
ncbi:28212_t:CDS:2 [Dentiscutata erythropus]|uniref:28212_t:CDS:1 n=1 Tax=Dentiscutata erythropus TaxID=1348616 RepID=A0A9N9D4K8_9GLOM|nr:28212_t:CDS:2 [Dentiscutata erythropus]